MKVTFKPCIHRHRQRKDKNFSVIIRIGYKSKYAFLETGYLVSKNDLSRKFEIKNQIIINKCNAIISEYSNIINNINEDNITGIQDIISYINKRIDINKDIDFLGFFRDLIKKMQETGSKSTQIYSAAYNHLSAFSGADPLPVKRINFKFLSGFEDYLKLKEIGSRGQNLYLGTIRAVYNACMDEYEEYGYTFNYPFRKYKLPKVKTPQTVSLTKENLLSIINMDLSGYERAERARAAFVISLFTLGTNATDLYDLTDTNNGRIEYKRNKTKTRRNDEAFISMRIESELLPYIERYRGKMPYLFLFREWYTNKQQFNKGISMGMKKISQLLNIPAFDFYDARRTIASVMRNKLGISKDDVSLCLNHKDLSHKTTDIYIEMDFSILDRCNRKFLDWLFEKQLK
ncbi:site-specific integrase [Dysgonomonas sp. GY75]|uniref:tyrosine-type recombinase/integrase n=1 Tax=Dysgonomonas sp. GY75 TaxID=2780419 RepID=UPI0018839E6F|nr:site-specific integrase [Dysgonomonas sp. GY75]MBF0651695.1 site-specific integrase [Dysgonomonas sp. GY75]